MIRPLARLTTALLLVGAAGWIAAAEAQPGPGRHGPGAAPSRGMSAPAPRMAPRAAPPRIAPRQMAPRMAPHMAPRGPAFSRPGVASPQFRGPREARPYPTGPRLSPMVRQPSQPPRLAAPPVRGGPRVGRPDHRGPRVISPPAAGRRPPPGRTIEAIRGERRLAIAGRNYSIWRDGHRFRRNGRWWTYAGLGTLGALAIAGATYYPYAYLDAPAPRCEGWTEDGCQLRWQRVGTLEGSREYACVAYCPGE
jgi:hypothetical protein